MKIEKKINVNNKICYKIIPENRIDKDFIKNFLNEDVLFSGGYRENDSYYQIKLE